MDIIKLNNNYYFAIADNSSITTDINNLRLGEIKKKGIFVLRIDFSSISTKDYKKILKKLLFIKKILTLNNFKIGISEGSKDCIGYLINYDKNNKSHNDFISGINAILYNTRYERYNYIYDTVCNYLDNCFCNQHLCDFKDNKCGEKRNTTSTVGCCRHFRIKWLGPLTKLVQCEYLNQDYTCSTKCISCKLFTCDYLKKKGIEFRIKDILLLNVFFNPIQKYFIKYMVFKPKEAIIKKIMFF